MGMAGITQGSGGITKRGTSVGPYELFLNIDLSRAFGTINIHHTWNISHEAKWDKVQQSSSLFISEEVNKEIVEEVKT